MNEKRKKKSFIFFLLCEWNQSMRLPIQLLFLSQLALPNGRAGEEKESWRAWPPWAYWEWSKAGEKSLNWVG